MIKAWLEAHIRILEWSVLAIAVLAVGYAVWHTRGVYDAAELQNELISQQSKDADSCTKAQAITKGANDDLQKRYTAIDAKLHSLQQQGSACIYLTSGTNLQTSGGQHAGRWGTIDSMAYRRYEARCETARSNFLVCKSWSAAVVARGCH